MTYGDFVKRLVGKKGKGFWSNLMPIYDFEVKPSGGVTIVAVGDDYVVLEERYFRQVVPLSRFRITIPK